jgi:hypothetical protein
MKDKLIDFLERNNMTVYRFAKEYGFCQVTVRGWINKHFNPSYSNIQKLEKIFRNENNL